MPDEEFRPGAHDLETPFIFVPHGAPDPVKFKRKCPGWVSFPATFVPHPRPIPKWKIINGQRWPLDKRGRPWPKTRYGRPTCPFDELPPGFPAPGTQVELMRKLENPMLFFGDEPMPTVAEVLAIGARSRAERAAAALPPVEPQRAYDGDGFGPARDYLNAMRVVDKQLREFAASARQEKAAQQARADQQDTASPERIGHEFVVTPDMTDAPPPPEPAGGGPAGALAVGGTAAAVGPAIPGALSQGALGRAAAGLLGVAGGPAALLGGLFWPSPTGDSTLSGTGLTLADAPGFEPPALPYGADLGMSIDPDAGKPAALVTPAAPQADAPIEVFDPPGAGPTVFDNQSIEDFRAKLNKQLNHVKPSNLDAARQEMAGKVVATYPDGTPYDHLQEVADVMTGMVRLTTELTLRLNCPDLSDADRQAATALLSQISRKIEEVRHLVPGIENKLGIYK